MEGCWGTSAFDSPCGKLIEIRIMGQRTREAALAIKEHIKVLRKGVKAWNSWRASTPIEPDLSDITLYDKMPLSQGALLQQRRDQSCRRKFSTCKPQECRFL